jgi:hypothetical protein
MIPSLGVQVRSIIQTQSTLNSLLCTTVSKKEGEELAKSFNCKFMEISVGEMIILLIRCEQIPTSILRLSRTRA